MCVCARIVAGGRHRQNFSPAISKYFWKKSLMRWSTCRTLPSRSAWGAKGFTPKKQIAPISRFPELSHKYRQNPRKSQENHKKTAYRKPHPTDTRKRST